MNVLGNIHMQCFLVARVQCGFRLLQMPADILIYGARPACGALRKP